MRHAALIAIVTLALGASACTEVVENYPEGGCQKDELRCINNNLAKCNEQQTGFETFKECEPESPCGGSPLDCVGKVLEGGGQPVCESNDDCKAELGDVGTCYQAFCDAGTCRVQAQADGNDCDDGNVCTEGDACAAGLCAGTPLNCDEGAPCTGYSCNPEVGCESTPLSGVACDDGQPCTKGDTRTDGICAGTEQDCDDGNPCTEDFCDLGTGDCVQQTKPDEPCDDGDPCTEGETCSAGVCQGGEFVCSCTTVEDCLETGEVDPCKGDYACIDEVCKIDSSTAVVCPQDGLGPCHLNQCINDNGVGNCVVAQKSDDTPCTDGNACTTGDLCSAGECVGVSDNSVAGCGVFLVRWYTVSSEVSEWAPVDIPEIGEVNVRATAGYPQIFGEAQNNEYRLRAIAPGL